MTKLNRKPYSSDLSDSEWDKIKHLIKEDLYCGARGRTKYPRREMLNAIFYIVRTGCQWADMPHDFPPWKSVYSQFLRWQDQSLFEEMNDFLRAEVRKTSGRKEKATVGIVDSQTVKTTEKKG